MSPKIWLSSPHMGQNELSYVQEAFETNWIAPAGPHINNFELAIANYLDSDIHVAALSSGTAGIHLALIILGVEAGDEVICQSLTFSGSANPIRYQGATPVFVDSEPDTWNMCPNSLEDAIKDRISKGKKPKAIIPVHLYGMPAKMDDISAIASRYKIPLVEDAAEALGSSINGKMCGTFGKISILSFNGNKIITSSGGGALLSHNKEYVKSAKHLSTQARDEAPHYEHSKIGYNYRMSNVCAGIGRGQMEVLQERVAQRRANFEWYKKLFDANPYVSFVEEPEGYFSNRWLTTILFDPKSTSGVDPVVLRKAFDEENIESRPIWKPMHMQPVFKNFPFYGSGVSQSIFENGLCLPSGSNLSVDDKERIAGVVNSVVRL